MHNLVSLTHVYCLVVLDHDLVEPVAQDANLAHQRVVIVAHHDTGYFLGPLLQLVELGALRRRLTLQIVQFAALNRQIFL